MKTHFISLVGLDFDTDLIPHWVDYYRAYEFDYYVVWLHVNGDTEEDPSLLRQAWQDYFEGHGFSVHQAYGNFKNGTLRVTCLKPYHRGVPDGDYLICADSDEFHQISKEEYQEHFRNGVEVISGELRERYGDTLKQAEPDSPLCEQYPNRGELDKVVPQSHYFAPGVRAKILAVRSNVHVSYIGSHRTTSPYSIEKGGYIVDHYTCRESLIRRMRGKTYYHPEAILDVARFFNMPEDHPDIKDIYDDLKDLLESQGWTPNPKGGTLKPVPHKLEGNAA